MPAVCALPIFPRSKDESRSSCEKLVLESICHVAGRGTPTKRHDERQEVQVQLPHHTLLHHWVNVDIAIALRGIALDMAACRLDFLYVSHDGQWRSQYSGNMQRLDEENAQTHRDNNRGGCAILKSTSRPH